MEVVWFLSGLLVGLVLLAWYRIRFNLRLQALIRPLQPDGSVSSLSAIARVKQVIALQQQHQYILQQEVHTCYQLLQLAPVGFLRVDEDNQLLDCNEQACRLLSLPAQFSKPRLLLELVRSYELDMLVEQTRANQKPVQKDWVVYPISADPSQLSRQQPRPLRGYGFPLPNGCVSIFLEDREETSQLAQQRDLWISDAAHELKTPLTSIRLVAETLQSRLEPPARGWVDRLLKEVARLSNLVQDLLDLSQLERQASAQLTIKTVDLAKLIQSAWLSLEPLARENHLYLTYQGPDSVMLQVDEARMHRVLINLMGNSIKYSPPHQGIQVRITEGVSELGTPQIQLDVVDAGPGFPEQALPHVFERFYRVDPSRSRSRVQDSAFTSVQAGDAGTSGGTSGNFSTSQVYQANNGSGLGLSIVRQIVEAHGGSVKAANDADTGGAWLQVILPVGAPVLGAES